MSKDGPSASILISGSPFSAVKRQVRRHVLTIGSVVGATGVSPNVLTLCGLALNGVAAAAVVVDALPLAGAIFLAASAFDMLDGAVARATAQTSTFGAFLDSVADRYDEAVMFLALAVLASRWSDPVLVGVASVALIGSLLVSYTRARAEGLGLDCEVGWLQRPERVVVLAVGLIAAPLILAPVLWLLAIVTNLTVIQRILHVRRLLELAREVQLPSEARKV
ncbi:MAG TPA: CDP-alcohol phosphatidyltransferase family protein [Chloroflexota bacterium]|nr:CDP-alcohol phosphatidyltransferase family protein [Chloroflexota bacterium]